MNLTDIMLFGKAVLGDDGGDSGVECLALLAILCSVSVQENSHL